MRYRRHLWARVLLVGAGLATAAAAHAVPEQPSVLILLSGQPGSSGAMAIASGIRNVLHKDWPFQVSVEVEHIDIANFASPDDEERQLRTVFGIKYSTESGTST